MNYDPSSTWFEVLTVALNQTIQEECSKVSDQYTIQFGRLRRAVINTIHELQTMAQWLGGPGDGRHPTSVSLSRHAIWAEYCVQHLESAKGTDSLPDAVDYTVALLRAFSRTQWILERAREYITAGHLAKREDWPLPAHTTNIKDLQEWLFQGNYR